MLRHRGFIRTANSIELSLFLGAASRVNLILVLVFSTEPLFHTIKKLHGLSPRANYTDRTTAACWRSDCQLLRIKGATWSA
jgi:hypothetical protein